MLDQVFGIWFSVNLYNLLVKELICAGTYQFSYSFASGLSFVLVRGHIGLDLFIRNISVC